MEEQRRELAHINSVKVVIQYILKLKTEEMVKLDTLLWTLWLERNNIREGNKRKDS
jgi:hypothetical protein